MRLSLHYFLKLDVNKQVWPKKVSIKILNRAINPCNIKSLLNTNVTCAILRKQVLVFIRKI